MGRILIRFYEELNDFLPKALRKRDIERRFQPNQTVKDLVESFGVPHTEVDLVLVNNESVEFSHLLRRGDRISVYPVFESFSIEGVTRLRPKPLREPKFVCDVHLGKLARRLRLLGWDVAFDPHTDDERLLEKAVAENRIVLTCDRKLLMRKAISRGMCILTRDPEEQVRRVLDRFDLRAGCDPFTRCTVCNGILKNVDCEDAEFNTIRDRIPAKVLAWCKDFALCLSCGKVYWPGSHYQKLRQEVEAFLAENP